MNVIRINFSHHYTRHILRALESVQGKLNFKIIDDKKINPEFIYVNDKLIGYITWWDSLLFTKFNIKDMEENDFKIIFKFHYSPNIVDYSTYGKYESRIVPCGLWRTWEDEPGYPGWDKMNLLTRNRPIDIMASMRHVNSGTSKLSPSQWPKWAHDRVSLKKQAEAMGKNGYKTISSMIPRLNYVKKLKDTKLSFVWSATSYLGWKIPEFTQEGVIMITEPLGINYPLCNDVVFENDVHYVLCEDPKKFTSVAKDLLRDDDRMLSIRKNLLNLWDKKLNRNSIGEWYYNKIMEAYGK